jgi:F-type H+-transporting ATPase subunit alpha
MNFNWENTSNIELKEFLDNSIHFRSFGQVISVADGVARVDGLHNASSNELVMFFRNDQDLNISGVILNLEPEQVCVLILGDSHLVSAGDFVFATSEPCSVSVGYDLLGRVINPLGVPLDISVDSMKAQGLDITSAVTEFIDLERYNLERDAPGIIDRRPVDTSVATGIKSIDGLFPIGRGQRELIVGDRQTGKTSIAIDTIISQSRQADLTGEPLYFIYVSVGQKTSTLVRIVDILKKEGAIDRTVIVSANASQPAAFQYLAPYAGCSVAEFFRDQGDHAVIIYDDLTKHANAYRQISLILRRPPGREAYPGDVFYLHSRLLERSANLSLENFGGSLTALPIVETQAGDLSGYIPTNVISITDGQIVTDTELFQSGFRPSVNIGLSVSRVGGAAQNKNFKKVAAEFKKSLAAYREIASFAQFGSEVDEITAQLLTHGTRLNALLAQPNYNPIPVEKQLIVFLAGISGFFDGISLNLVPAVEAELLEWFEASPIFGPIMDNLLEEYDESVLKEGISYFFNFVCIASKK